MPVPQPRRDHPSHVPPDAWGDVAYIKPIAEDGLMAYAVYAGDGHPLAIAPSRELAIVVIRQQGLVPADAH